jgi:membrane protein DedA with SNARE-associated domain
MLIGTFAAERTLVNRGESASRSDGVVSVGEIWVYLGFFVTLVAAGLGFPAPEELVITGGGVLAGQLPPEPEVIEVPIAYPPPTPTEVARLLTFNPHGGFPGGLPWAGLYAHAPHQLSPEEVIGLQAVGLLAVNPEGGFPGGLPWATLAGAGPAMEQWVKEPTSNKIRVRWWIMLPVCIAGVVLSDLILFSLGWWGGDRLMRHRWVAHLMPPQRRRRTEENFHRYGVSILVFGRLVPGIRAPLFLTAGSMRLPLPRFLLADGLGAVVGNSFFFFLGYWLGDSVKTLIEGVEERLKPILIIVIVGVVVAYLLWLFLRHPVSTGDPAEVPLIGPQVASHIEHTEPVQEHPSHCDKSAETKSSPAKPPPSPDQPARKLSIFLIVLGAGVLATCLFWHFRRQLRG